MTVTLGDLGSVNVRRGPLEKLSYENENFDILYH